MHVVASIRSISVCVHIIPCSMLIFASDWLATVKERHLRKTLVNDWRDQRDVFNVWWHWWRHNGDRHRSWCTATIVTIWIPSSTCPAHTETTLSLPKINPRLPTHRQIAVNYPEHIYHLQDAASWFPNCSDFLWLNDGKVSVIYLFHNAWRLSTRFELNVCFVSFRVCPGPGMNTSSCHVDTRCHLWHHNSNELPSNVTIAISVLSLLRYFTLRDVASADLRWWLMPWIR